MDEHKIWSFNGESVEIDFYDVETLERFENATIKLAEEQSKEYSGKASETVKQKCEEYFEYFNSVIGDDKAAVRLFNGKMNLSVCVDAYYALNEFMAAQITAENERVQKLKEKYSKKRIKK